MRDSNFYLGEREVPTQEEVYISPAGDLDIVSIPLKFPNMAQRDFSADDEECEIINSKYLVYWAKYSQDSYNQKVSFPKMSLYGNLLIFVFSFPQPQVSWEPRG